jgi:hypothetical protein
LITRIQIGYLLVRVNENRQQGTAREGVYELDHFAVEISEIIFPENEIQQLRDQRLGKCYFYIYFFIFFLGGFFASCVNLVFRVFK